VPDCLVAHLPAQTSLAKPKSSNLDQPIGSQHHVFRFDVTMNNAGGVAVTSAEAIW